MQCALEKLHYLSLASLFDNQDACTFLASPNFAVCLALCPALCLCLALVLTTGCDSNKLQTLYVKCQLPGVQLPNLHAQGQGTEIMLVSYDGPDAACTAQLQELVESSHASITVLVIPEDLVTHTDRHHPQAAVAVALQDLPTPHAVLVMHAPEPASEAGHVSNHTQELSMHSVAESAHSSGCLSLAEVIVKVRAVAVTAMGDCSSDEARLEDDEPLLAAGLTSAGAVEIVRLLEEDFDISLPDTLVCPAPLCSTCYLMQVCMSFILYVV